MCVWKHLHTFFEMITFRLTSFVNGRVIDISGCSHSQVLCEPGYNVDEQRVILASISDKAKPTRYSRALQWWGEEGGVVAEAS